MYFNVFKLTISVRLVLAVLKIITSFYLIDYNFTKKNNKIRNFFKLNLNEIIFKVLQLR